MASGGRWLEGTRVKRSAIRRHVRSFSPHPFSPANNCCRYIFKLHTLRYNLQAFNLSLILLLILLLSNWLLLSPVWPLLSPISPLLLPIWPLLPPDWLLLSQAWPSLLSPLVWALYRPTGSCHRPFGLCCHCFGTFHLACLASVLQPVWQPYSPLGQKIYNTISFSSLREWTAHIKIVHGITYRCLEACCLYT